MWRRHGLGYVAVCLIRPQHQAGMAKEQDDSVFVEGRYAIYVAPILIHSTWNALTLDVDRIAYHLATDRQC